jgi:hypothetical protein
MERFLFCVLLFSTAFILNPKSLAAVNPVLSEAGTQYGIERATEVRKIREQSGERIKRPNDKRREERNLSIDRKKIEQPQVEYMQEQQSHHVRQEMRRELIQRYEHKQRLSPPAIRRFQRIDRRKEKFRIAQPYNSAHEKQLERKNKR